MSPAREHVEDHHPRHLHTLKEKRERELQRESERRSDTGNNGKRKGESGWGERERGGASVGSNVGTGGEEQQSVTSDAAKHNIGCRHDSRQNGTFAHWFKCTHARTRSSKTADLSLSLSLPHALSLARHLFLLSRPSRHTRTSDFAFHRPWP